MKSNRWKSGSKRGKRIWLSEETWPSPALLLELVLRVMRKVAMSPRLVSTFFSTPPYSLLFSCFWYHFCPPVPSSFAMIACLLLAAARDCSTLYRVKKGKKNPECVFAIDCTRSQIVCMILPFFPTIAFFLLSLR